MDGVDGDQGDAELASRLDVLSSSPAAWSLGTGRGTLVLLPRCTVRAGSWKMTRSRLRARNSERSPLCLVIS
ncbi:hypothetical protein GCM10020229_13190 [Kitasatospora albolonga]